MKKVLRVFAVIVVSIAAACGQNAPGADDRVEKRINDYLGKMTLDQKIDFIGGYEDFYIRPMLEIGLPGFKMADGPIGVRNYGPSTTYAAGIALAASWNVDLANQVGTMIGHDALARSVHFMLGPGVNIYRAPMNGRNFEYFGEDPFLASRMAVNYIEGMQSLGVSSTIKHFMGNNSEFLRHDSNSIIDERTMREIYLPVFEAAVKEAHVGAIMDSYNLVNGEHSTQNSFLNNQIVKKEWGFPGVIMSDWSATYDGVAAANGGLDLEMPSGKFMNRENLLPAIKSGKVSEATIDDKVRRILRTAITLGWLDRDQDDTSWSRYSTESNAVALDSALESMVLLRNAGNLLPLDKSRIHNVAVIGPDAYPGVPVGGGSARVRPFEAVSFLQGISDYLGSSAAVFYRRGIPTLSEMADATSFTTEPGSAGKPGIKVQLFNNLELSGTPVSTYTAERVDLTGERQQGGFAPDELMARLDTSGRWTGYYSNVRTGEFTFFVQANGEGSGFRLFVDDKKVLDDWEIARALVDEVTLPLKAGDHKVVLEQYRKGNYGGTRLRLGIVPLATVVDPDTKTLAQGADVVILAVGFDPDTESEGADRTFVLPPGQEQLIREIAASNEHVVVVLTSGGNVAMNGWGDNVQAMLEAWYPGQAGGTALAKILFGDANPSGHLPVTFEENWDDNPVHDTYYPQKGTKDVNYREGIFVGYRGYEKNDVKPRFPFGYGLSYTTFKYANLQATPKQVAFDVTNTGQREGATVAQVYIGEENAKVPRPAKELKGFAKMNLKPGETRHVTVPLDERSFAYYDVGAKQWQADAGTYDVMVGTSVEDIALKGTVTK